MTVVVAYVEAHKASFGVEPICDVLEIAHSTYYAAKNRQPCARALRDAELKVEIERVYAHNRIVYGTIARLFTSESPRITCGAWRMPRTGSAAVRPRFPIGLSPKSSINARMTSISALRTVRVPARRLMARLGLPRTRRYSWDSCGPGRRGRRHRGRARGSGSPSIPE